MDIGTRPYEKVGQLSGKIEVRILYVSTILGEIMQLYGYKSSFCRSLGRICYCCDCQAEELSERNQRKRNRKRVRRLAKLEIKNWLQE